MTNHKTHPMEQMKSHFLEFNSNIGDMLDRNFIQKFSTNNTITNNRKKDDPDFILRYVDTTRVVAIKSNEDRFFEHNEGTYNIYNSFSFVCNNPELSDERFYVAMEIDGNNYLTSDHNSLEDMATLMSIVNHGLKKKTMTPASLLQEIYLSFVKHGIESKL